MQSANISRPGRPGLDSSPTFSTHYSENRHYKIGTADPKLRPDAGAGAWRSLPITGAALAQRVALDQIVGLPTTVYPGPNATRHLRHYLDNSGRTYTIDLEGMIRNVPSAGRALVSETYQALMFVQTLPIGRHLFTSRRGESKYNLPEEGSDWFYAIGGYTHWGKGEARISPSARGRSYEVDFTYCFYDRYNWDGGKSVEIGGMTVTDEFMGEFHRQGLAQEFDCVGSVERSIRWDGDFTFPTAATILTRPGR